MGIGGIAVYEIIGYWTSSNGGVDIFIKMKHLQILQETIYCSCKRKALICNLIPCSKYLAYLGSTYYLDIKVVF